VLDYPVVKASMGHGEEASYDRHLGTERR